MSALVPHIRVRDGDRASTGKASGSDAESVRAELKAMLAIIDAFVSVPDERIRARMLAWTCERFGGSSGTTPRGATESPYAQTAPVASRPGTQAKQEQISVEGLEALFHEGRPGPGRFPPPTYRRRRLRPTLMLRFRWWT
ncbi:MAG: hypothetical protein A3H97_01170 [Acidobacteria bacterium RIFCSPLOWO2_02_FULL_65_29]|nr:MAG: hypothetical protein A3H97_01170 [Acidobacteria bacterium RIFCSPLOWO2_02_FULL_65_29]